MAEAKKPITATNKGLIFLAIAEAVIIVVLFLSGFKRINPYLLLLVLVAGTVLFYYYLKKPKVEDFYEVVDKTRARHLEKFGKYLDARDVQAMPLTPELSFYYFPLEGLTFYYSHLTRRITGIVYRHLFKAVKEQEKSDLFKTTQKHLGAESRLKSVAETLNVDLERIGLENV